jgi:hypothetical protein
MTFLGEIPAAVVLLGSDSLVAGLAIGPWVASWRAGAAYALLFGVSDGMATVLGATIPHRVPEPPAILIYLVAVGVFARGARHSRLWLCVLPVLVSLDNLAAGRPASGAVALALSSALMAALGMALGGLGRRLAIRLAVAGA